MYKKFFLSVSTLLIALSASALQFTTTNTFNIAEGEIASQEQWIYANEATIDGTVKNDLLIFTVNDLQLNGSFDHGAWGMSSRISLAGTTHHNTRLISLINTQVSGEVNGNLLAIGDLVKIDPKARINGDAKIIGNSVILEGVTSGDVTITATRTVTIAGEVKGNLTLIAPPPCEIILHRSTQIQGDLIYTSKNELVPAAGLVAGKTTRVFPPATPAFSIEKIYKNMMWFIAALLAGIPFISLFPMTTAMSSQLIRVSPFRCLWVGLLICIVLPILGFMSCSSAFGLPLGILILGSWGALMYLSQIVVALTIGSLLRKRVTPTPLNIIVSMAIGLVIIYILTAIPMLSRTVHITVISIGTGSLILSFIQKRRLIIQVPAQLNKMDQLKKDIEKDESE